jgi:hypothetical protein
MAQDGRGLVYGFRLDGNGCKNGRLDVSDKQMEELIALSYMDEEAEDLQIELYMRLLREAQRANIKGGGKGE